MKWLIALSVVLQHVSGLAVPPADRARSQRSTVVEQMKVGSSDEESEARRSLLLGGAASAAALLLSPNPAGAAVGSLPELQDTNVVLQGITIKVADPAQQKQTIEFLQDAFDMVILRGTPDGTDTWLGYGPEQLSIPGDFTLPVSAFGQYGGHASVHVQYDAQATSVYYRGDGNPPGNNLAYLQVGVPQYRVSQMVKNGGNVVDAYGYINVISPSGFPMRGIVGIWPDPMMFCAINCKKVQESKAFYEELGFTEQEYPYCRPLAGKGDFEPPQPKGSVYMAPSPNSMGVLLLPSKKVTPSPVMQGLNLVYTPAEGAAAEVSQVVDPSGVGISFVPYSKFEGIEKTTRVAREK